MPLNLIGLTVCLCLRRCLSYMQSDLNQINLYVWINLSFVTINSKRSDILFLFLYNQCRLNVYKIKRRLISLIFWKISSNRSPSFWWTLILRDLHLIFSLHNWKHPSFVWQISRLNVSLDITYYQTEWVSLLISKLIPLPP